MKISRIFQLLPVLVFGIVCCLLAGCAQKCIVPKPTLQYTDTALIYTPDASIAGVTSIILNVLDSSNTSVLSDTLAPGESKPIPANLLNQPITVVTQYLNADFVALAKDEQVIIGGCRFVGLADVVIISPVAGECDTLTTCTNMSSPASSHTINWNNRDVKIVVQNVSFLARWASDYVHVSSCNPDIANNFSAANSTLTYDDKQGNNGVNFTVTFTAASNQTTVSINSNVSGGVTTGTCQ